MSFTTPNRASSIIDHMWATTTDGRNQGRSTSTRTAPMPRYRPSSSSATPMPTPIWSRTLPPTQMMVLMSAVQATGSDSRSM